MLNNFKQKTIFLDIKQYICLTVSFPRINARGETDCSSIITAKKTMIVTRPRPELGRINRGGLLYIEKLTLSGHMRVKSIEYVF